MMPTMYEIYENHAVQYDELVNCEDYRGNFKRTLNELNDFSGQTVIEFGSGTGRVTSAYIEKAVSALCFDRSRHMQRKAEKNLKGYLDKISFGELNNLEALHIDEKADVVIEGWSFGHTVSDNPQNLEDTVRVLVSNCENVVKPGGKVILIETLGTCVDEPDAPGDVLPRFYELLEKIYGFERKVISMDYRFDSLEDAVRIMGFFFGDAMAAEIKRRGALTIPEFTGIWLKNV